MKTKKVQPAWRLKGFDEYFVGSDNHIYKLPNNKQLTRCMHGYSKGYFLRRKFHTLHAISQLMEKVEKP